MKINCCWTKLKVIDVMTYSNGCQIVVRLKCPKCGKMYDRMLQDNWVIGITDRNAPTPVYSKQMMGSIKYYMKRLKKESPDVHKG